tara:strand:+ start:1274 stop:1621 length:348 start_codon:yes stop_codon:yes gene_type:complete
MDANKEHLLNVAIGQKVSELLNLKLSKKGTVKTSWGNKTWVGLGASILQIVKDAENAEEPNFDYQELEETNIDDLEKWITDGVLHGLIDENLGGIIGYIHGEHINRVVSILNKVK